MHLHLFPPPPPLQLMPFLLTAALAFAAGVFLTRRGVPRAIAEFGGRLSQRWAFWRRSCDRARRDGRRACFESRRSGGLGNSAFDDYRRATLRRLEDEAAEFRTFLHGLKRAADAAEFDAFLKSRREGGPQAVRQRRSTTVLSEYPAFAKILNFHRRCRNFRGSHVASRLCFDA